jgi:hypothetical protein
MSVVRIDEATLETLRSIAIDENLARITAQLDRNQYVKTNKILELLGGKWDKKKKAHIFEENCAEIISDAIVTGEVFDAKKAFQLFETPVELAERMVNSLYGTKLSILEPSVGKGRIAKAAYKAGHSVFALDIQDFASESFSYCNEFHQADFLNFVPCEFGAVLMNPPFSKSQDIKHILHAWKFLPSGGELRAIASIGFTFRQDDLATKFRTFLYDINAYIEELPIETFKESGANVKSVLISAKNK